MSNFTQSLLPLSFPSDDSRPLPEIVADGKPDPDGWPAFLLAYKDVDGKRYYAIQDWIRGVAQSENPRRFWSDLKKRLQKAGIEVYAWCVQLPYRAANGKKYDIDHTDAEGLYRITQRMDANTGLRNRVLDFLAASGAFVDGQRIDAIRTQELIDEPDADESDRILDLLYAHYYRMGKDDRWIAIRVMGVPYRKRFTAAFQRVLRISPSSFQFAEITDTMRRALWKRDTKQLRAEMGLKSNANLRDHLSGLGLLYEAEAEEISTTHLNHEQNLEFEEAKRIVRDDAAVVGKHAKEIGQRLGIDIPTGRPLLPAKTKKRS
jgi:hypothetical protein